MAVTPLNAFTFQAASTVTALGVPNAFPLPAGSTPTTVLVTNMGPEAAYIALTTAAKSTTATQATVGANTIVVADATSIAVGQLVLGVGIASGGGIPAGYLSYPNGVPTTTVTGVSGTTITLSAPITAALSSTAVVFVASITPGAGLVVMPNTAPVPLVIGSNTYIQTLCVNGQSKAILNVAVGV